MYLTLLFGRRCYATDKMSKVIIVSNRLPVSIKKTAGSIEVYPSVGGLATALYGYTKDASSKWIGWPGIAREDTTEAERRLISRKLAAYNCYPVFLTKKQLDEYYNGFSNSILWPLFHNLPTKLDQYEKFWKAYREINQLFTDAILALGDARSTVWVHDYQLLLVPEFLRAERPHDNIGLFLHIPFPPTASIARLKHGKQLLVGMLGADLVGFHTPSYTNNFLDACSELGVGLATGDTLVIENRVVRATDFPISIDYTKSLALSTSADVMREARAHRRKYGRKKIILTVDRLDPTKGLVQRLKAYREFLRQNPSQLGKVVMVMLATPSRTEVAAYKKLKAQVEALVTDINETYGVAGWLPVDYKYETLPYEKVVALYKIADVAFITPLRDGMNLVAKEYIASKQNGRGVLILSETAGAAEELTNAIIVNPRRLPAMAGALNKALTMPTKELKKRLSVMQKHISINNVQKWSHSFMCNLQRAPRSRLSPVRSLSPAVRQILIDNYDHAIKRHIFLDYDGTLASFKDNPADAKPSKALYRLLEQLAHDPHNNVVVVSGRSGANLDEWLGDLPVTLAAEHGAFVRKPGGTWSKKHVGELGWKKSVKEMMEVYAARTPGAFVEEKQSSLVWHYRKSPPYQAQKNLVILKRLLIKSLAGTSLRVHNGNKILEVKPKSANKGRAVTELIRGGTDFILAIGDDYTDEDMFKSLPAFAFTIKVGAGRTQARYRIQTVDEAIALLKKLV